MENTNRFFNREEIGAAMISCRGDLGLSIWDSARAKDVEPLIDFSDQENAIIGDDLCP